jgi:ArsR family transcriptional regulator
MNKPIPKSKTPKNPTAIPQDPTFDEMPSEDQAWHLTRLAQILKAAGHPIRLEIIKLLEGEEVSVAGLIDQLELSYPVVSTHLAYLRRANIVSVKRVGTAKLYWLEDTRILPLIDAR